MVAAGVVAGEFEEETEDGLDVSVGELGNGPEGALGDVAEYDFVNGLADEPEGGSEDEVGDVVGSEISSYCRSVGRAAAAELAGPVETEWVGSVAVSTEYGVSAEPAGVRVAEPVGQTERAGSWPAGDRPSKQKGPAGAASVVADHLVGAVDADVDVGEPPEPRLGHAEQTEAARVSNSHLVGWVCWRCWARGRESYSRRDVAGRQPARIAEEDTARIGKATDVVASEMVSAAWMSEEEVDIRVGVHWPEGSSGPDGYGS